MKKKTTVKASATKATRKTTKRSGSQTILIHRIFIVSACLTLFVVAAVLVSKPSVPQAVLGTTIMKGSFAQATVEVPPDVPSAASYNLYYKLASEEEFTNAVRNISPQAGTYTISHLKKGENYVYRFVAVDDTNTEVLFSETLPLKNIEPME